MNQLVVSVIIQQNMNETNDGRDSLPQIAVAGESNQSFKGCKQKKTFII